MRSGLRLPLHALALAALWVGPVLDIGGACGEESQQRRRTRRSPGLPDPDAR